MAAVYKGRDTRTGALVAIKEMSFSAVSPEERSQAIQNFLAEARILSRLNHPNLPAFTDFFTEEARRYLVMEFIDGETLEDLLDRSGRPIPERRVLSWAKQLCDVLEYLHSQQPPVIFRDMKPGNIMLTRSGQIKLIDFGIARLFRNGGPQVQDTQLLGTPGYAPPEQYGSAQTDERSDIYSLAMTLYHLMTCSISEKGFGLHNVHADFPQISPLVARALEKATELRPEDRYESIVVFRRALLGIGTFRFENGSEATTPEELAELCARFPEEAWDYLTSGEVEAWLQEIGASDLARVTKRIRATVGSPEMGVNRFLQAVMGPQAQIRATMTNTQVSQGSMSITASRNSRGGNSRTGDSSIVVRPKFIDFGQVYPGLSAPVLLTVSGAKGAQVNGVLRPSEPWIILDQTSFDGMSTPVRVRVDSTALHGATHFSGSILIASSDGQREISVPVDVDVISTATTSTIASRTSQTMRPVGAAGGSSRMAPQVMANSPAATVSRAVPSQAGPADAQRFSNPRYDEQKAKYGTPGSGGWVMLQETPRQAAWRNYAKTFSASVMAGAFFYLALASLPFLAHTPLFSPNPWFTVALLGILLFTTLGTMIINLVGLWGNRDLLNRLLTGLATALVALGLAQTAWVQLGFAGSPLQVVALLLISAAAATFGTTPRVSNRIIRTGTWMMTRMVWLVYAIAIIVLGSLGYSLTSGFSYGCFAPFGAVLGAGIGVALVLRIRRLIQLNAQNAQTP